MPLFRGKCQWSLTQTVFSAFVGLAHDMTPVTVFAAVTSTQHWQRRKLNYLTAGFQDKISNRKISNRKISKATYRKTKYRSRKISKAQNIDGAKYRNCNISNRKISNRKISKMQNIEMQNIEGAKYREAKYRKQNIEVAKYRSGKISKDKISKWQNIERQNIEVAEYRTQIIEVAKYRTRNIEVAKYRKQNIEVAKYRTQNIEVAKYRKQNIEVAKYRTQKIEVVKYRKQNIEVAKYRKSCRFAHEWARASLKKASCSLSQDEAIAVYTVEVLGQPVTSDVRSITQIMIYRFRGGLMSYLESRRTLRRRPSSSLDRSAIWRYEWSSGGLRGPLMDWRVLLTTDDPPGDKALLWTAKMSFLRKMTIINP